MLLTREQFANLTGFDRRTVAKRLENLTPAETEPHAKYDSASALRVLYGDGVDSEPARDRLTRERVRLTRAQAQQAEYELAETEGRLIDRERVGLVWETATKHLRDTLLALHSTLLGRYPDFRADICESLRGEVRQLLTDFSRASEIEHIDTNASGADGT